MTTATDPGSLARTPLYEEHAKLGARLVPYAGWEMPVQYRGLTEEHRAVRMAAGLFDVSHMGELWLSGEHATDVLNYHITNDASRVEVGQALYTCACNAAGGILDDLIVYRFEQDRWLIVCNASNRAKMAAHFEKAAEHHCEFEDRSDETALLSLQGPRALDILATMEGGVDAHDLASFRFREGTIAGVRCTIARTGYTGEDGVELFCASGDAVKLWRALLVGGHGKGLEPAGLGARDTLRLEARLSLYGNDIDETTNPLEAGLGWVVKLDKGDFIGRAALERIKAEGVTRKLIGFEMTGRGIARHGYPLLDRNGVKVGLCTSGSPGPTVGKSIGLGYLPTAMSSVGSELLVDCRGRSIEAVVVKTPFYKRG